MKGLLLVAVFTTAACAAGLATSGTFSSMSPSLSGINAAAPRYTTQEERLVSEIAGSILNIAAFADHFEPGDPFQVRSVGVTAGSAKFSLARRAEVFTVEVPAHVWVPASYARLARSFMADGGGMTISEDSGTDREDVASLLGAAGAGLVRENARLSRLLQEHPRSSSLHERAALLLASAARRASASGADVRPVLCRMTAHLAVARALHVDGLSKDGQLAEHLLVDLAARTGVDDGAVPGTGPTWADGPVIFGDKPHLLIVPEPASSDFQR